MKQDIVNQIYGIAHDIKAPLSSIRGLIELSRRADEHEKSDILDMVNQSVGVLEDFIQSMLDRAFPTTERQSAEQEIKLPELLAECADMLQWMNCENKPEFEIEVLDHEILLQDEWLLKRVIHNLLSNSIKYHQKDRQLKISIKAVVLPDTLLLNISDNGRGIHPSQIGKVFDKHYKTNAVMGSHGLGLSIVKDALDKMGGHVKVKSSFGVGSQFLLQVPNRSVGTQKPNELQTLCGDC